MGEVVAAYGMDVKIESIRFTKTIGKRTRTANGMFLIVKLSLKNRGDDMLKPQEGMFKALDANNAPYGQSPTGIGELRAAREALICQRTVQPGQEVSGLLIFDVPNRTDKYALLVDDGHERIKVALEAAAGP